MSASFSFTGIQVKGASIYSVVAAINTFSVLVNDLMQAMNVQTRDASGALMIDTNAWYDLDHYMPVYKKIDTLLGGRGLEKVGSFIPKNAEFPPNIQDIHGALASIDVAFHMNHRKDGKPMFNPLTGEMTEGIGHYRYQPVAGKNEALLVCDNPCPCRFDQGLIKGMAQRFQPQATLTHVPDTGCRTKGDASCTYVVTW
ncbi:hypothetical protein HPC49_48555 [Pyxidicoccus fallax]|uniref:4-vinyl reductase 4VR domain-containing protein n=1 Tax=Pyxidicoccus fallax TaxID=394095 RepID=A0A848LWJ4_9BACT|nr:hypothetical protein [Pyxidicoccus fallax]NMO21654.1 hypothetical protein [Pyxidicoccus fallax]NPC86024.1 hypothetical protein [Pyxidicoccus fallax]